MTETFTCIGEGLLTESRTTEYRFELPTFLILPRVTKRDVKVALNMNTYRNLQFHTNNQMKQMFEPIGEYEKFTANIIEVSYHVEKPTKRRFDTMNVVSVVDKFFLDWLQKHEYILDDTCHNVVYKDITGMNATGRDRVLATIKILE